MPYRLVNCPRCGNRAETVRPYLVEIATGNPDFSIKEPDTPEDPMTVETEEWFEFRPCGHVIPPEEYNDRLDSATRTC